MIDKLACSDSFDKKQSDVVVFFVVFLSRYSFSFVIDGFAFKSFSCNVMVSIAREANSRLLPGLISFAAVDAERWNVLASYRETNML